LEKLDEGLTNLREDVKLGFSSMHGFGRSRVSTMKEVSQQLSFKGIDCAGTSTRHAVYFHGKVVQVAVAHHNCSEEARKTLKNVSNILTHSSLDLLLFLDCPNTEDVTKGALNISSYTKPQLGDDVVGFGFGKVANVWKGTVAVIEDEVKVKPFGKWKGVTSSKASRDEYLITTYPQDCQNGAATANGCGYIGMAHAVVASILPVHYVLVIKAEAITKFITLHFDKLKSVEECGTRVVNMPVMPFIDCETVDTKRPTSSP
jgi:hypothetical protein